jgi:hypothetical protein
VLVSWRLSAADLPNVVGKVAGMADKLQRQLQRAASVQREGVDPEALRRTAEHFRAAHAKLRSLQEDLAVAAGALKEMERQGPRA